MSEKQPTIVKAFVVLIVLMTAVFSFAMVMHVESQMYEKNVQSEGVLVSDVFNDYAGIIGDVNKIHFTDEGISLDTGDTATFIIKTEDIDAKFPVLIYLNTSEDHHRWNIVFYNARTQEYNFYVYAQTPSEDGYTWWTMTLPKHGNAILNTSNTNKLYVQSPNSDLILSHGNVAYTETPPVSMKIRLGDPNLLWVENGKVYSDNWKDLVYPTTSSGEAIGDADYHISIEEKGIKRLNYTNYEYNICNYYIGESEVTIRASNLSEFEENLYISLVAMVIALGGLLVYLWLNVKDI